MARARGAAVGGEQVMRTAPAHKFDLWTLVRGTPQLDPDDLLSAVENELQSDNLDYRSRLLVRESLLALQNRWGSKALSNRLSSSILKRANDLLTSHPGEIGFPTLGDRMRERTDSATILEFLRELGN